MDIRIIAVETPDADNRVDESNVAAFAEIGQRLGRFMIGVDRSRM